MDDNHFYFYVGQVFSALFIIGTAWFTFKSETTNNRWGVFACSLALTIVNYCTAYHANNEANRADDTVKFYRNLHTGLMNRTLDSSHKIIDTLNGAIQKSSFLIIQNDTILKSQKTSLGELFKQAHLSAIIQKNVTAKSKAMVKEIDSVGKKVRAEFNDEDRYAYLKLRRTGSSHYTWTFKNPFDQPVFMYTAGVTNYDMLTLCRAKEGKPLWFIDSTCYAAASRPLTLKEGEFFTIVSGEKPLLGLEGEFPIGRHRLLFEFGTRNRLYQEEMVLDVKPDFSISQTIRLTDSNNKTMIFLPDENSNFNNEKEFDSIFPVVWFWPYKFQ